MKQGRWGELILEKVLELSGLRKGEEYDTQTGFGSKNLMQLFFCRITRLYLLTQKHLLPLIMPI
ncbi:MAG: DNA recombination protein RmuC [Candidatus Gastranaerophilaceae bacterium]